MIALYIMTYLVAIILGVIEGATEFIPVSSTGHLIVAREFLGAGNVGGLAFDAVLQLSATLSLVVYFWKDILRLLATLGTLLSRGNLESKDKTLFLSILIGTIPAIVFGLLLEEKMDTVFRNVQLISLTLVLGSVLFWLGERFGKQNKILSVGRGVLIGLFQCLALVPGVSRSGATISGGLLSGLTKDEAVRFSFLLSIPILLGSGLKKLLEIRGDLLDVSFAGPLLTGSVCAFIVGLFSINFLIKYLKNHSLNIFIWYRVILAILILIIF